MGKLKLVASVPPTDPPAGDRPEIAWRPSELSIMVNEAEAAVLATDQPPSLFQTGGALVRLARAPAPLKNACRDPAAPLIVPVSFACAMERLTAAARWSRTDRRTRKPVGIHCPELVARAFLDRGSWGLPILRGVVEAPTLRADGSILQRPGYDEASGLVFDPGETDFPPIPEQPTRADALAALEALLEILRGFPFDTEADRSVALAAILTALVRKILPSAPLIGYSAPKFASGKTLSADLVALIATGRRATKISPTRSAEEERKILLATLLQGDAVICLDNVPPSQPYASDALSIILTSDSYADRLLGESRTVRVSTRATFLATGNSLRFKGDMTTRALLATIDPQVERPDERAFDVDLLDYVPRHRGELAAAGLTILHAYNRAGRPTPALPVFGRFEAWSDLVRSALVWLELPDPNATRATIESDDPQREAIRDFLHAWLAEFGHEPVTVREVLNRAKQSDDLREALNAFTGRSDAPPSAKSIGRQLLGMERRIESGLVVTRSGTSRDKKALWRVREVGA